MAYEKDMSLTAALIWITLFITVVVGWCMNIYQITQMYDGGLTAKFAFKIVGVLVFPLGAFLGLFN
jgi:hypothetical protein